MAEPEFFDILANYADRPGLMALLIFLFTFILEDAATVSSALLASYGRIPPLVAYVALALGIMTGDAGLYGLGYLARKFTWAEKILHKRGVGMVQSWLNAREIQAIIAARFIPGARLPTYTAMGFFRLSFRKFMWTVFFASLIWTSILFMAIYSFGMAFVEELGHWRWPVALGILIILFAVPRLVQTLIRKINYENHSRRLSS